MQRLRIELASVALARKRRIRLARALEEVALPEDIYLLCSDGLTDMIDDDLIEGTILNYRENLEQIVRELVHQANDHGGKDNVSAMLAKPVKPFPANENWFSRIFDLFS